MNYRHFHIILLLCCSCNFANKPKIFYLNSYHLGYGSSDQIMQGIVETLDTSNIDLRIFFLDAKRLDNEQLNTRSDLAWNEILKHDPDIIISSDDNAMESVIVPHLKEILVPVLYCGLNWSADKYNLPTDKASGMLEILPVERCIETIRRSGYSAKSVTVISEKSIGEIKNKTALIPIFESQNLSVNYEMVPDFDSWKAKFALSQQDRNIIFLPTNGAIQNWDHENAVYFVDQHAKVPVFTCDDFMLPYSCFGLAKIASEQGEWTAQKALEILNGKSIQEIPMTKNSRFECLINQQLCEKIQFGITDSTNSCKVYEDIK